MLSPRLFRLGSRIFRAVYGRFPILGELRSSIALIKRDGRFLMQRRSDGLGWAFPGGVAWFWEKPEQTLRREVFEETGMVIASARLLFVYHDRTFIPSRVSVFAAQAEGELHGSWEGEVGWRALDDVRDAVFAAQKPLLAYLDAAPTPVT